MPTELIMPRSAVPDAARTGISVAGAVCLAAGLFGAAATAYLAMVSPVGAGGFTFPHGAPEFTGLQMVIAALRVGLVFGLLSLWWCGAIPMTGSVRFARYGAFVMMAVLIVVEGLAVTVPRRPLDGTPPTLLTVSRCRTGLPSPPSSNCSARSVGTTPAGPTATTLLTIHTSGTAHTSTPAGSPLAGSRMRSALTHTNSSSSRPGRSGRC
jgi:hypothetical protein